MCSKCQSSTTCDCIGGSALAVCACEKGRPCPVCEHDAAAEILISPAQLEIVAPEVSLQELE